MVFLRLLHRDVCNIVRSCLFENPQYKRSLVRKSLSAKRNWSSYEGDGKTIAIVLNKKNAETLSISGVMKEGFALANGTELVGSIILFPHSVLSWHVMRAADVTEESLVLFKLLEPKIDILVFGYGTRNDFPPEVHKNFSQICKKLGLRFEALPTDKAVGVFNFLSEEQRFVAAALIPPSFLDPLRFEKPTDFYLEDELEEDEKEEKRQKELKLLKGVSDDTKLLK